MVADRERSESCALCGRDGILREAMRDELRDGGRDIGSDRRHWWRDRRGVRVGDQVRWQIVERRVAGEQLEGQAAE